MGGRLVLGVVRLAEAGPAKLGKLPAQLTSRTLGGGKLMATMKAT